MFPVFYAMGQVSYFAWFVLAVKVALTGIMAMLAVNCLFYWNTVRHFFARKGKT